MIVIALSSLMRLGAVAKITLAAKFGYALRGEAAVGIGGFIGA